MRMEVREMMKRPTGHCGCGSYEHTIPMPLDERVRDVDFCIAGLVAVLNAANRPTDASCCGHGRFPANILLRDGRRLIVCTKEQFREIFTWWTWKQM